MKRELLDTWISESEVLQTTGLCRDIAISLFCLGQCELKFAPYVGLMQGFFPTTRAGIGTLCIILASHSLLSVFWLGWSGLMN